MSEETAVVEEVEEKPVYGNADANQLSDSDYSENQYDEFMSLYEESISGIQEGQVVVGSVVTITANDVMVDIGFKSDSLARYAINARRTGLAT